jgi:HlyD family secretion protein
MKRAITALLIIAAIGAGAGAYYMKRNGADVTVNTAPVTRGDIVDTVGATGTLQAVTTVQVGSQVSGNIQWLGADFNSIVHKGQVIARLDPSLFQAQVEQAKANLAQAQANLARAQSDLERTKVQLADAQQKYTRARELAARSLLPQSDLDSAKVAVDSAQASLASQEATVKQTQAAVAQSQATLNQNQVNLDHTIITAPIDGIVTQRSVDAGQTVAASLQSPTLFIIAADLTRMQVNANIDEADVGRIRPGQHVTFRVDAYPTEQFEGTVAQIRLQPTVVQNVTTYGTVIDVPNQQLKLKPGMTANVKVEVAKRSDVLRVPNNALRFRPTAEVFAALNQAPPPEAQFGGGGRGGRGGGQAGQRGFGQNGQNGGRGVQQAPAASAQQGATESGRGSGSGGFDGRRPSTLREPQGRPEPGRGTTGSGQGGGGGGADEGDRRARMLERFKTMSPDEQKQFIARMKERGADVSAFERPAKTQAPAQAPASSLFKPKYGEAQSAQTIDALFAPLPSVETRGRVWLFINRQLKPVNLRLGVSDGTNTEVLGDELQVNTEVATGVTGTGNVRPTLGGGTGNPFNPQRGFGGRGR